MKVIKRGELPETKVYGGKCQRCSTEVEFVRGEAKYNSDQRDGDFLSIACPVCTGLIYAAV